MHKNKREIPIGLKRFGHIVIAHIIITHDAWLFQALDCYLLDNNGFVILSENQGEVNIMFYLIIEKCSSPHL